MEHVPAMADPEDRLFAGVDAGGTTFKCGVADGAGRLLRTERIPVGADPEATLAACADAFQRMQAELGAPLAAAGVGCFGPLEIDPTSPTCGAILATPKPGWSHVNVRAELARRLDVPVRIDTDVNAALGAEMRWGAAQGAACAAYVTVGTGIGAGLFANGGFLGSPAHPEFGHIAVRRHPDDPDFAGNCPFHGDCLEGMAAAPAFAARFGDPQTLAADHPAWRIEAQYLAQGALSLFLTIRPQVIVMGGGLMLAPGLIETIREEFRALIGGYLDGGPDPRSLIVGPGLGDEAGLLGGVRLALDAVR